MYVHIRETLDAKRFGCVSFPLHQVCKEGHPWGRGEGVSPTHHLEHSVKKKREREDEEKRGGGAGCLLTQTAKTWIVNNANAVIPELLSRRPPGWTRRYASLLKDVTDGFKWKGGGGGGHW